MIEVKNLCKSYAGGRQAIHNISFTVQKGEILGLLGPNGAGKSTTMKILSGYLSATSGKALLGGFDVQREPLKAKALLGYLPEVPPVYGGMEVESYLSFAAQLHQVPRGLLLQAVEKAMEKCGLLEVRKRFIGNLSKGYRQRVGLAQAIVHEPSVLILDEPTVGLDPKQIVDIRELICNFKKEHTVILSTHILPEVQATCDRVVVIDQGEVVAIDTLSGITSRVSANIRLDLAVGKDPRAVVPKIKTLSHVLSVEHHHNGENDEHHLVVEYGKGVDHRAGIAKLCVDANLDLLYLNRENMSLEGAFMKLISKEGA